MLSGKLLLCVVLLSAWHGAHSASIPLMPSRLAEMNAAIKDQPMEAPEELPLPKVREGVPPPLCAGHCAAPPAGPVCAFDATGTARTFATLCELEAVSCRESTYYAITSIGEC